MPRLIEKVLVALFFLTVGLLTVVNATGVSAEKRSLRKYVVRECVISSYLIDNDRLRLQFSCPNNTKYWLWKEELQ